jgi:Tfp pilus assembly protein PilN
MIQFNLLPEVKKEYVKTKRTKRMIMSSAVLVSVVSIGVVVLLYSVVQFGQKKYISDMTNDIQSAAKEIQATEDINTVLTVQNQLGYLNELHQKKPKTSRLFDYIAFVTPKEARITNLKLDVPTTVLLVQGTADNLATVNKYVENLKAVTYADASNSATEDSKLPVFSGVKTQLSGDNNGANFTFTMTFDAMIFDNTKEFELFLANQSMSTKATEEE